VNYYYLIAGLPDLSLDEDLPKIDVEEVIDTIQRNLSSLDEASFRYLLYTNDNRNFLNVLFHEYYNFPTSTFLAPATLAESVLQDYRRQQSEFPSYLCEFIRIHEDQFSSLSPRELEEILWVMFYEEAEQQAPFIANYFRFDRQIKEMAAIYNSVNYSFLPQPTTVGGKESGAIGRGKTVPTAWLREYPYLESLGEVIATKRPDRIEKFMDRIRWDYLEDISGYFGCEQVFAYALKLLIVVRWQQMSPEKGSTHFEERLSAIEKPIRLSKPSTV